MKKLIVLILTLFTLSTTTLFGCSKGDQIVIGSKDFGENIVISEIIAQLIEAKTDLKVERKQNMGGTFVVFEAIKKGDIDIYPEYTGTALTAQLKMDVISDPDKVYNIVKEEFDKQFNIKWMDEVGFNNTYAITVTREFAETNNLKTVGDLAALSSDLVFGAEHEFYNRQDGFDGLIATYDLNFKDTAQMNHALKYPAIDKDEVQVIDAYSTDGEIKKYDLVSLKDDKNFFPPYYIAPIVKGETLEKYPELEGVLNMLGGKITEEVMIELNYRISVEGDDYEDVANDFLVDAGLID